jgi:hypothetical protein
VRDVEAEAVPFGAHANCGVRSRSFARQAVERIE